ncbi:MULTISPECIES: cell division protein FtsQ/DivIB [Pseudomonas]|uniref:Cell division protein FtsQ n=1 Tax=Pseudomonas nitroreducens TaxID=46680 RepID=A0A6G6IRV0_PSENT|nr:MULTISPECIES: cell division protein FtsQ/DivIB [Pseudomonas]MCE4071637.1 cell division protein FtsQ/DivIB [Pseudomonas nitritireducens]MCE4081413.1 cell division protein FtsQ/DivIB [Pseudomonas nitroreducens]MCJ1882169.1 cell division protein FtsQ/DivIB [Pseudomonas nitroreducens]MCJ1893250.1 cell division protein FtsQ/DivIB [Pseudomonas nitroreducens]QIE85865.1 cell division protein FtsQ/DivIB [Pseudomonas nitroreducens]
MNGAQLRHQNPGIGRAPARKPVPRGASRLVAKEPLSARMPKPSFGFLKVLLWPLVLGVLGGGAYYGAQYVLPYADRPIAKVSVEGDLSYISQAAVQQRISPYVSASFFTIDLAGMRQELEQMPWIAHAEVRRVWPDQVVIRLDEQLPIARWGDEALLNNQGQAFAPREVANYEHLPRLSGPQRAQQQVMQQYQILSQMLRPLGFTIASLDMSSRGAWTLGTAQGVEIMLGRDHAVEQIRRLVTIYDKALKEQITKIARIDMRYPNGLAVAWRDPVPEATVAQTTAAQ